jgi:type II secretory pathway pseudopilin PulG
MIVVVILGILMAIAIPIYNGVQERAKYGVGEANANMLNRGITQLKELGYYDTESKTLYTIPESYDPTQPGVGGDEPMNQQEMLLRFVGLDEGLPDHVKWGDSESGYVVDIGDEGGIED